MKRDHFASAAPPKTFVNRLNLDSILLKNFHIPIRSFPFPIILRNYGPFFPTHFQSSHKIPGTNFPKIYNPEKSTYWNIVRTFYRNWYFLERVSTTQNPVFGAGGGDFCRFRKFCEISTCRGPRSVWYFLQSFRILDYRLRIFGNTNIFGSAQNFRKTGEDCWSKWLNWN